MIKAALGSHSMHNETCAQLEVPLKGEFLVNVSRKLLPTRLPSPTQEII